MERRINGPEKETLSAQEAAAWLGVPETVFEEITEQLLPGSKMVFNQRTHRWTWEVVVGIKLLLPYLIERLRSPESRQEENRKKS